MLVKVSIQFLNNDSDDKLIGTVNDILTGMTGNANYPAPTPTLPEVTAALEEFTVAKANTAQGGRILTAIKNEKREALVPLVRQLAIYVQANCQNDLAILMSSGFPIQKPQRQPVGVLPPPSKLTVTFGPRTGELRAVASPVAGAAVYNWKLTTQANPNVVVAEVQTTAARNTFAGLTPGVTYTATVSGIGAAGPSSWSEPVSQVAV
jgi:hypothetical protein